MESYNLVIFIFSVSELVVAARIEYAVTGMLFVKFVCVAILMVMMMVMVIRRNYEHKHTHIVHIYMTDHALIIHASYKDLKQIQATVSTKYLNIPSWLTA